MGLRGAAPEFEPGSSRSCHFEAEPVGTGPARAGVLLRCPLSYTAVYVQYFLLPSIKENVMELRSVSIMRMGVGALCEAVLSA